MTLLENGKAIYQGEYDDCLRVFEQKARQDMEAKEGRPCEIQKGLDDYSRVELESLDWYTLRVQA